MLASMGRHCFSILFLSGRVGRVAKGPEWASLVGWGRGLRQQGAEWGSVRRLTSSSSPVPTWMPSRRPRGTANTRREEGDCLWVQMLGCLVSPELRVVEMGEQSRRQEEGLGSGRGQVETRG